MKVFFLVEWPWKSRNISNFYPKMHLFSATSFLK